MIDSVALDYLHKEFVITNLCVASRKRLFEELAQVIVDNNEEVAKLGSVFKTLNDRERLGSTGLGKGIALPHGRLEGLETPVIAVAKLTKPIDYDAIDGQPVWLAICLLVPIDANETHLKLLSRLASGFEDEDFINRLEIAHSTDDLFAVLSEI